MSSTLIDKNKIKKQLSKRKSLDYQLSVPHQRLEEHLALGWVEQKKLATVTKLTKPKPLDVLFEDKVWRLFGRLGFTRMNADRNFRIAYSKDGRLTQQVDVFAADSEVAVLIECKASLAKGKAKKSFKTEIDALASRRETLIPAVKELLGNKNVKVLFALATSNYEMNSADLERLSHYRIHYFDEDAVAYYEELVNHLGTAARFQLEANLFPGQKISALDNKVPAIRGKMGGHTYFTFVIEPEKLLKMGYVLHRNTANKALMPTYQRLIKRSRLKSVREFVNSGRYFPNSLIINIDRSKLPRFDLADSQLPNTESRIGILYLPKTYRSVFIIDGQHRLYGYADSKYSTSNAVPVVAFVGLEHDEQVRLFMEINENQKAVSKNLRHTLNADLDWDSADLSKRIDAIKLQIAQDLGEDLNSPLFDRVIVGESQATETRNLTLDTLKKGLDRTTFFGDISGNKIKKDGTFFNHDTESTYAAVYAFLLSLFGGLRDRCQGEWNRPTKDGGLLVTNPGMQATIRLFSDIVEHVVASQGVNPKVDSAQKISNACADYLDPLQDYFERLGLEERKALKSKYGSGGPTFVWRSWQQVIADAFPDFEPEGLEQFWKDNSKLFNTEAYRLIMEIETFLKTDAKERLYEYYGDSWFKQGVPNAVYEDAVGRAAKKNRDILNAADEVSPWDCLHMIDYRKIAIYAGNWANIFSDRYTPLENKNKGNKEAKTEWMVKLNNIRNKNFHEYSVKEHEFEFLKVVHGWLLF